MVDWLNTQNNWVQVGISILLILSVVAAPVMTWGVAKGLFKVFDALMTEAHVSKSEYTAAGHASGILRYAAVAFMVLGGAAGAIIGGVEAWMNLSWVWSTFITAAIIAMVIGVVAHVDDLK